MGTNIEHYQAQTADGADFNRKGQPDWLASDPGVNATGVNFVANPGNPLRGVFCQAPRRPLQDKGGIYYTAQFELYLPVDLGEVFELSGDRPKRQDRFVIGGKTYYAIAPSMPCQAGDTVALFKIELNIERYPVG